MGIIPKNIILHCKTCKQKLRFPYNPDKEVLVTCPICKKEHLVDFKKYNKKFTFSVYALGITILFFIIVMSALPFLIKPDLITLKQSLNNMYLKDEEDFTKNLDDIKKRYEVELASIKPEELKAKALAYYKTIWNERQNYNSKYALSPREKAQLKMLTLANDRSKTVNRIIKEIAQEASPHGADINVYWGYDNSRNIDINFHMSALTSGEEGTRTKHRTIDSLKKEVISLISKVTNDVYEFTQDLELQTIKVGLKHLVITTYPDGREINEDTVLYKISINRKDFKEMKHNPFLDIYSTTKYFNVEVDNFSDLTIKTTRS